MGLGLARPGLERHHLAGVGVRRLSKCIGDGPGRRVLDEGLAKADQLEARVHGHLRVAGRQDDRHPGVLDRDPLRQLRAGYARYRLIGDDEVQSHGRRSQVRFCLPSEHPNGQKGRSGRGHEPKPKDVAQGYAVTGGKPIQIEGQPWDFVG